MSRIAAIQMTSGPEVAANLASADRLLAAAADAGAKLAVLPENFALMARTDAERLGAAEDDGRGLIQDFLAETARQHGLWLVGGTLPIKAATPHKARATCLLFNDKGERVARYDKIHLFDATIPTGEHNFAGSEIGQPKAGPARGEPQGRGEQYRESAVFEHGTDVVVADTPFGKLGLAVCYDLRFPELFRAMVDRGAELFAVPSAFTAVTGRAHWELLVRARAVENFAYVIAAAQGGRHASGRETYGHTMVVNPWGEIVAQRETGEAIVVADCDRARQTDIRARLPSLRHRRLTA